METVLLATIFLITSGIAGFAQHGTAPDGYYRPTYHGDIWTGEVVSTNDATREITLTYKNGVKSETFTGVLKDKFLVKLKDGSMKDVNPSDIRTGARITVFYETATKKVNGNKLKYNEIFQITLASERH